MPVQPIRLFGDPVLRTPAEPVRRLRQGAAHARQGPHRHDDRRARAPAWPRPQLGVGLRVFTYYVDDDARAPGQPRPRPVRRGAGRRGGLPVLPGPGLPDQAGATAWSPRASNMHGEPVTIEGTELLARCVQHETDHLDGILFIDRLDREQRKLAHARRSARPSGPASRARRSRSRPHATLGRRSSGSPRCGWSSPAPPRSRCRRWTRCSPPRHEVVAVAHPAGRPAGRGRRLAASPVAQRAAEARSRGAQAAARRATRSSCDRLRELAPDCCPVVAYGALVPPAAAGHPAARLGQPALLAAARLARRGAGAARGPARRRGHRRHDLPARGGPRHRAGVRRAHRADPARRHQRRPARPARRRRRRAAGAPPSTASRTATLVAVPQPADGVSLAPKLTVEDARVDWSPPALHVDRLVRACTPAPGRLDDRAAASGSSSARSSRLAPATSAPATRRAGSVQPARARSWSAPATARGRARRGAAAGQASDAGGRLGPRRARPVDGGTAAGDRGPPLKRPAAPAGRATGASRGPDAAAPGRVRRPARGRRAGRLRQPRAAGAAARARHRPAATRRSPPSWPTARCAAAGTYDAVLAACVDRPLDQVDPPVLDVLRLGAHQLLGDAGAGARRRVGAPSTWPGRSLGDGPRAGSSTRCCARSARSDLDAWLAARRAAVRRGPGRPPRGRRTRTRAGSSPPLRDALGGGARARPPRCSPPTTCRPQVTLVARPGPADGGRAASTPGADAGPLVAVRRDAARRRPGALAAVRERRAGVQDEGSQLVALALAERAARRAGRSAGSTCAPGPAARPRCSAALAGERGARAARRPSVAAAPGRAGRGAPSGDDRRRCVVADGARRRPGSPARSTGSSSTRRAPGSARCAAGPRRAGAGSPRTSAGLARAAARRCSHAALDAVRPGGRGRLRHLLAAPGRDPRSW